MTPPHWCWRQDGKGNTLLHPSEAIILMCMIWHCTGVPGPQGGDQEASGRTDCTAAAARRRARNGAGLHWVQEVSGAGVREAGEVSPFMSSQACSYMHPHLPLFPRNFFLGCLMFPATCTVYLRDKSAQTVLHAATLRWKLIIIIIIIIAFKGAIRDFLQSPHSTANRLQHVRSSGPGATVCKSRATHRALFTCKCHVTCHLVRRDSSAIRFDRVEIAFIWALFYWLNH